MNSARTISRHRTKAIFKTWKLVGEELVLKREQWRRVDFGRCNSSADILDWIFHYHTKNLTQEEMCELLYAIQVILHPCKNYCSSGMDKRASGLALLKEYKQAGSDLTNVCARPE
jgi:hypothetical protein